MGTQYRILEAEEYGSNLAAYRSDSTFNGNLGRVIAGLRDDPFHTAEAHEVDRKGKGLKLWTSKVDDGRRVIWTERNRTIVLLLVGEHDSVYRRAERLRSLSAEDGTIDAVFVDDDPIALAATRKSAIRGMFDFLTDDELRLLGVPDQCVPLVRAVQDEDSLQALEGALSWASQGALIDVFAGIPVAEAAAAVYAANFGPAPSTASARADDSGDDAEDRFTSFVEELTNRVDAQLAAGSAELQAARRAVDQAAADAAQARRDAARAWETAEEAARTSATSEKAAQALAREAVARAERAEQRAREAETRLVLHDQTVAAEPAPLARSGPASSATRRSTTLTAGRRTPADVSPPEDLPAPGAPWPFPRGSRVYRISKRGHDVIEDSTERTLSSLRPLAEVKLLVTRLLTYRPSGGRIWVDDDGDVCTRPQHDYIYLGRVRSSEWFPGTRFTTDVPRPRAAAPAAAITRSWPASSVYALMHLANGQPAVVDPARPRFAEGDWSYERVTVAECPGCHTANMNVYRKPMANPQRRWWALGCPSCQNVWVPDELEMEQRLLLTEEEYSR